MIFIKKCLSKKLAICIGIAVLAITTILIVLKIQKHHPKYEKQPIELPDLNNSMSSETEDPTSDGWVTIRPRSGDTLGKIFARAGLPQSTMYKILEHNPHAKLFGKIALDDEIRFQIENNSLTQMILPIDSLQFITVIKDKNSYKTTLQTKSMTERREYISAEVKGSLYQTAKIANIPAKLIDQMNKIFFWQVQLAREIKPGDRLNISYQSFYINDQRVKVGDILAVSYRHPNGTSYEAIRHEAKNGVVTYYRPNGTSLGKAFNRYPIRFSHISSNFGSSRQHPILHYRRPHKGIDLAAPIGTPIYSIGDGRVEFMGRQNGYGNMIKITHDKQYTTVYAHLLKFHKDMRRGSSVRRGQIIGFVGQSGLATGPHCHYELHVHHIPRNPATVALPQAMPIPAHESFAFHKNSRELLAQLKLIEDSQLATAKSPGQRVLS
jgi:murein DD-endopeptidase MepM/ murein hydrolase activator NlpD